MSRNVNTRTVYKIIGSDYSAQEPRMSCFISGDEKMYEAYNKGKDLYAMIAQSAFDNNYEDNLEFWPEGTELEIDGQKVVSGSGKERHETTDSNDSITVKYYELLETQNGDKAAQDINIGDEILSDIGNLKVINKLEIGGLITFTLFM